MSTIERKTPQALRSRQRDRSASALRPDEALLLSLQETAGNRAVSGLIQRVRERAGEEGLLQGGVESRAGNRAVSGFVQRLRSAPSKNVIQRNQDYTELNGDKKMSIDDSEPWLITATTEGHKTSRLEYKLGRFPDPDPRKKGKFKREWIIHEISGHVKGHGGAMMYHLSLLAEKDRIEYFHATTVAATALKNYENWGFSPDSTGVIVWLKEGVTEPDQLKMVADWFARVPTVKMKTAAQLRQYWTENG